MIVCVALLHGTVLHGTLPQVQASWQDGRNVKVRCEHGSHTLHGGKNLSKFVMESCDGIFGIGYKIFSMKDKAPRNRTITLSDEERISLEQHLLRLREKKSPEELLNRTIHQDLFEAIEFLPEHFVDLLFLDPPYNLTKNFATTKFHARSRDKYEEWLHSWMKVIFPLLRNTASVYICGDWRTTPSLMIIAEEFFHIRNRITWEREKGRGAGRNWKNCSEDILFCTVSEDYTFNLDAVKMQRRVNAPYRENGKPKDWVSSDGGNFRLTHPSNLWTDITVPFWSMPENTPHPTQKPEKLLAKIILASSRPGDIVFDPFLGSGTTSVVARKLGRRYLGIERELEYALLAEKRLARSVTNPEIQGFYDGVFWERNSAPG